MSIILNIETSANSCSICISENTKILFSEVKEGFSHAEMLAPMVKRALEETKISLDALAVSMGPGSYTGLRIGTSFAKGLCFSLNIPLIAISTLKILAKKGANKNTTIDTLIPMIDARRDEVYLQSFTSDLAEINKSTNLILEAGSSKHLIKDNTLIIGSGSVKAQKILSPSQKLNFIHEIEASANDMPFFSHDKFAKNEFEDLAYFEPFYLKPFYTTQKKK